MPTPCSTMVRTLNQSWTSRRRGRRRSWSSNSSSNSSRERHPGGRSMNDSSTRSRGSTSCDPARRWPTGHVRTRGELTSGRKRSAPDHPDLHARVLLVEQANRLNDVEAAGHEDGCDADRPAKQSFDLCDGIHGPLCLGQRGPCRTEEGLPGIGQLGTAATSHEQGRSQPPLERQQRGGQARLRHEHPRRRATERAFLDDGQEVLQLSQFHCLQQRPP